MCFHKQAIYCDLSVRRELNVRHLSDLGNDLSHKIDRTFEDINRKWFGLQWISIEAQKLH